MVSDGGIREQFGVFYDMGWIWDFEKNEKPYRGITLEPLCSVYSVTIALKNISYTNFTVAYPKKIVYITKSGMPKLFL